MKTEYDFSKAKRGAVLESGAKTRISIYLDDEVLAAFRTRAEAQGKGYQTLINETLRAAVHAEGGPVTQAILRQILREELRAA